MIEEIIKSLFGDIDTKKLKNYQKIVESIKAREVDFEKLSEEDVKNKTLEFKALFTGLDFKKSEDSEKIKKIIEDIKVDAFALVKQATKLLYGKIFTLPSGKEIVWNMIPYDVQLIGGLNIHYGGISEMKTGEGKTLVATLPAYLNALSGNPVHIVTVNDYLAKRDAEEMGILYSLLGLSVGVITHNQGKSAKKEAYKKDIVYATNNEMGFDYLRDNMVIRNDDKSQSKLFFAIIDEVDSILVDEARTPLIISMPDNEPTTKYIKFAELIKLLEEKTHYTIDEKQKTAVLTEAGIQKVEELLKVENIYISTHYNDLHHIENALKAMAVYKKDKDYIVVNDEVLIVDEHTGRVLSGRRYSEGLHQAIEAKEKVKIQQESKTLASITFQNFFRMYWKLSGMTGTAKTEEEEFYKVYALDTLVIPTNKPIIREDKADLLFKNEKGKFDYVVKMVKELHEKGQPILVGTVSVDKSEYLSQRLREEKIPHNVLNAKYHEQEAEIIAGAGQKGAVTIATNMAGRGTDIKLGEGVVELGGLFIIGTEKHETRRIDNQLRGRAGRQGDPGVTQFLVSPNDDIMRIFGGDKLFSVFNSPIFASLPDDEPLAQSGMLTKRVTSVQKQVEGHNFDIRKHILEYDDVINKHREIIYGKRNKILASENIDEDVQAMIQNQVSIFVESEALRAGENLDKKELALKINEFLGIELINESIEKDDIFGIKNIKELAKYVGQLAVDELISSRKDMMSLENFLELERRIVLQSIDELWMNHIDAMSHLREEVAFEGYAQRNPLIVYKEKAFQKFGDLMNEIEFKTTKAMFSIKNNIQVEEVSLDESDFILNEINLNPSLLNKKNPQVNPLLNTPQNNDVKVKIRV
ncbi:preprotein translocase subunit SecA [Candidatus Gracilibacteria bacterium]|nr:preprotein translocase subunit SecA [Candidatus Gracilibacteria bacterium]NUJ98568.1 preprotein translocase subunit SecA [Candidatus Gracilibacteria bacterium]